MRLHRRWPAALHALLLAVGAVLLYGPVATLAAAAARQLPAAAWFDARSLGLITRSVLLSSAVALTATLLGTLAASVPWASGVRLGGGARGLLFSFVALPAAVQALGWLSAADAASRLLWPGRPGSFVFAGWPAAFWVQLMASLPLTFGLAWAGLEAVDPRLVEAARVSAGAGRAFARVALPLAAPAVRAGFGLAFVFTLLDVGTPSLFGVDVAALDLYATLSLGGEPGLALARALPLLAVAVAVLAGAQLGVRALTTGGAGSARPALAFQLPRALRAAGLAALGLSLLTVGVPGLVLASTALRGGTALSAIDAAWSAIRLSLLVATGAVAASLPLGWALASELATPNTRSRLAWWAVLLPLALPPPLFGLGLAAQWSRLSWPPLYGTLAMPVLACLPRAVPVAALLLAAERRRSEAGLLDAARVFARGPLHRFLTVQLPLVRRGVLAAAGLSFALALGELGATLLVVPPGAQTLTLRVYAFLHAGASQAVAGLCLLLAILVLLCGALAGWCLAPRSVPVRRRDPAEAAVRGEP